MTGRDRETLRYPVDHEVDLNDWLIQGKIITLPRSYHILGPKSFVTLLLSVRSPFESRPLSIPIDGDLKTKPRKAGRNQRMGEYPS